MSKCDNCQFRTAFEPKTCWAPISEGNIQCPGRFADSEKPKEQNLSLLKPVQFMFISKDTLQQEIASYNANMEKEIARRLLEGCL